MIGARSRRVARPDPGLVPRAGVRPPEGPLWVDLTPDLRSSRHGPRNGSRTQAHPIDLRWVDELVASARPHLMVRPEDDLLILVPNTPVKLNATGVRVLEAMLEEGVDIAEVLRREGDGAGRRRELHYFFSDLQSWLRGNLGEGLGHRAVVQEPFDADYSRYPVLSEVALTYRCNLTCAFCYAGCAAAGLPDGWSEERTLSDDAVCRVLDRIRSDARCPSVSFTGGEPTVRPALPRFVRHAKELGMKVNLITNGQRLSERLVTALADAGLDSAQLSLEGPDAATHDGLVRRPGAFDRLWRGLDRLRAAGIRVHTNTTVNRRNVERLPEIVDLVADRGLPRLSMNLMLPCGTGAASRDLWVSYSEVREPLLTVQARAREREVRFLWYSPVPLCVFNTVEHGLGAQGCAAADGLLHVNPAGDVLPCSSFHHTETLGNLLCEPFEEIWGSREARWFRGKEMKPPGCEGCSRAEYCQGACPLYWREAGTGELR
jgi:radical SAM protein with 4Fe4S-binding SPASM domain